MAAERVEGAASPCTNQCFRLHKKVQKGVQVTPAEEVSLEFRFEQTRVIECRSSRFHVPARVMFAKAKQIWTIRSIAAIACAVSRGTPIMTRYRHS